MNYEDFINAVRTGTAVLGALAQDKVSDLQGIVCTVMIEHNGNIRLGLQPKAPEGSTSLPEAMFYDEHTTQILEMAVISAFPPKEEPWAIGKKVVARTFGANAVGVIEKLTISLNGCVFYTVVFDDVPGLVKQGWKITELAYGAVVPAHLLALAEPPVQAPPSRRISPQHTPSPQKPTGGPPARVGSAVKVPR